MDWEEYYYPALGNVVDTLSEGAKQHRFTMRGFERLRDWELFRFCQGFEDDTDLGIPGYGPVRGSE